MDKKTEQWGGAVSGTSPIGSLGSRSKARPHINCYIVSFKLLPPPLWSSSLRPGSPPLQPAKARGGESP